MSNGRKSSLWGPLAIATGGTFIVCPILLYTQLLFDGRLSFPYQNTAFVVIAMASFFVFFGLLIASRGLQLILDDYN